MKSKNQSVITFLLVCFCMLILAACDKPTTCKAPVGATVPKLDPKIWNAHWMGPDGSNVVTAIKNADFGIVTISGTYLNGGDGKAAETKNPVDVVIRTLQGDTVASVKDAQLNDPNDGYLFARVAINEGYLLIFPPNDPLFRELNDTKLFAGVYKVDNDGKPTKSVTLEELSDDTLHKLTDTKYSNSNLFDKDPFFVFVRAPADNKGAK